jgi:anaerobic magnesium-protoporphyrin IX monomethyl ester cyclase
MEGPAPAHATGDTTVKVMFVYPDQLPADPGWQGHFYSGLGILSAVLKQAGHQTSLLHITRPTVDEDDVLRRIETELPGLLAFSCTTFAFPLAARIAQRVKQVRPDLLTLFGGLHPTLAPDDAINTPGVDVLCRGEGENALLDLVRCMETGAEFARIPGLWIRDGGTVHRNPIRPLIQDLDALPFADRDLFDYANMCWEKRGWATVMMSRGCAYSCTYCANHAVKKLHDGEVFVRFRGVDNVIAELEQILSKYGFIHNIHFDDDLPFVKQDFVQEFCEKYKSRVGVPFRFNLRPNVAFEDRLRLLKDAGGAEAKIGLESGNEHIVNNVLKRRLTVAQTEQAFQACHRAGLKTQSFNMVGLPTETPRMVLDTIKLNAKVMPSLIQVSIFYPFPGTQLWEQCAKDGILDRSGRSLVDFFTESILRQPSMSQRQVRFYHHRFHALVRLYRWALRNGRADNNWRARLLDALLVHEPSRRGLALIVSALRPLRRLRTRADDAE